MNPILIDKQDFVNFWIGSAESAGVPVAKSALQLRIMSAALNINLDEEVHNTIHFDKTPTEITMQAVEKNRSNNV